METINATKKQTASDALEAALAQAGLMDDEGRAKRSPRVQAAINAAKKR